MAKPTVYTPNIMWLDGTDVEMAEAVREAQVTFDRYRDALLKSESLVEDCGVKVYFPSEHEPHSGEHMWVNEVSFSPSGMVGKLCNDPGWIGGPVLGERVPFVRDRVSDWFVVIDGVLQGGYTLKLLYRSYSPEQFAECRHEPPACYLADWYDSQRANTER